METPNNSPETPDAKAAAEKVAATEPEVPGATKKRRQRKPKDAAGKTQVAPAVAEESESFTIVVTGESLAKSVGALLQTLAVVTETSPPKKEETQAISEGLATGLRSTRFALDKTTGPWVPLLIALAFYSLPRGIEALVRYAEQKEQEEANAGGTFQEDTVVAPAALSSSSGGPVRVEGV